MASVMMMLSFVSLELKFSSLHILTTQDDVGAEVREELQVSIELTFPEGNKHVQTYEQF